MMEGDAGPSSQSPSENEPLNRTKSDRPNNPDRKTLQHFFMKASDLFPDASASEPPVLPPQQQRNHNLARCNFKLQPQFFFLHNKFAAFFNSYITCKPTETSIITFCRHALNRQLAGRLHPWANSRAHATFAQGYKEASFIDSHPWRTPVLGAPHNPPPSGFIQCAQFDSTGELLVTGNDDGTVLIHSGEALQEAAWDASFANLNTRNIRKSTRDGITASMQGSTLKVDPILALYSGLSKVHHVRWNPANENVIATACSTSKTVHLFDLQQTQGRPKQSFSLPMQISGGAGDIAFFGGSSSSSSCNGDRNNIGNKGNLPGGGYTLLIGGPTGQAYIWDVRMAGPPAVSLHSTRGGAVTSVALIENDHAVVAATQGGDIKAWDLRGGSGGALRFGGIIHHHPILTTVDLRLALLEVPNLAEQAGSVPSCTVHAMVLNPHAPHRAGFHLGCGWSGVLDLHSKRVTHLHAPPQPLVDEQPTATDGARAMVLWAQMAAPHLRRRACWTADGRRFAVPSRQKDALLLLDFEETKYAGCYALPDAEENGNEIYEVLDDIEDHNDNDGRGERELQEECDELEGQRLREDDDDDAVMAMDVEDRMHMLRGTWNNARIATSRNLEEEEMFRRAARRKRNPPAVEVPLSQAAICAAAMPVRYGHNNTSSGEANVVVAGGAHNFLSLVLP